MIPSLFTERIRHTFSPGEAEAFLAALDNTPAVSVRLHAEKKSDVFAGAERIPWHPQGYYLAERPEFIFDPAFHAGAYYVQESSSMFVQKALDKIDLPENATVLDLCAAPGGKSTLLLSHLPADALLLANEAIRTRIPALKENIQRWGYSNAVITQADPAEFEQLPDYFDVILVDAPCSGEGMFRKDPGAAGHWSPEALQTCELRQARILKSAAVALKPGGYLIYSTCTFNPGENEARVRELLANGFEPVEVSAPGEFPEIARVETGYAFYPHRVKGEGFFLALLRKTAETDYTLADTRPRKPFFDKPVKPDAGMTQWLADPEVYTWKERNGVLYAVPQRHEKNIQFLSGVLPLMYAGVAAGSKKGNEFLPEHALALSTIVSADIPALPLPREDALRFLKKESIRLAEDVPKGLYAVRHEGLNLGWTKAVPGRLNNLLPVEFRIRKHLDF